MDGFDRMASMGHIAEHSAVAGDPVGARTMVLPGQRNKRPLGVLVIGICGLLGLCGVFFVQGMLALFTLLEPSQGWGQLGELFALTGWVGVWRFVQPFVGMAVVIALVVAVCQFLNGQKWAWYVTFGLQGVVIAYAVLRLNIVWTVLPAAACVYLVQPSVRGWFGLAPWDRRRDRSA